jgi:hypothetical protein
MYIKSEVVNSKQELNYLYLDHKRFTTCKEPEGNMTAICAGLHFMNLVDLLESQLFKYEV